MKIVKKLHAGFFICIFLQAVLILGCSEDKKNTVSYNQILQELIADEDTDGDKKITIEDKGDKSFGFIDKTGERIEISGTYHLSNLLQELAIVGEDDTLSIDKIKEQPTARISRLIKTRFWDNLTRSIDKEGLANVLQDTKSNSDTLRLYIPNKDSIAFKYFEGVKTEMQNLKLVVLPEKITPEYVKSINDKPGILNLNYSFENGEYKAKPFVVPGGRFNEMYGWDSYFESVGLLIDGRSDLAMSMADNFAYQINYYGKILNANRSYYLTRTQPPFYSSLIREIYEHNNNVSKDWLRENLKTVIKEYETVWMNKGRLTDNNLNRFYGEGIGIPPETEEGHFDFILKKHAAKLDMSTEHYVAKYQSGELKDKALDEYFTHDRSMRESGHDTSNRLDAVCIDLNTVGLNSLLYKYEEDLAFLIKEVFNDKFEYDNRVFTSADWQKRAESRKDLMNKFMWNKEEGVFYDYNHRLNEQQKIESATNYYPLWVGLATEEQAAKMVEHLFQTLVEKGGVAGTSDLTINGDKDGPQRQWDYPNGWAPHQMTIWRGLKKYGYDKEAQELVYRWLWMITKNAVDYNGTIPEKYDVVNCTHKVYAEYGNVGTDFDYITPSGFGWMNASYQLGLSLLDTNLIQDLNNLKDPDVLFKKTKDKE